jgi:hypothetical protein
MDNKMREVLKAALDNTRAGTLSWEAFTPESFRARVGRGFLHILWGMITHDAEGNPVSVGQYTVQVSDGKGRIVADEDVLVTQQDGDSKLVQDLYRAARTSALGGYQVLDNMLDALKLTGVPQANP